MKVLLVGSLCDDKWIGNLIRHLKKTTYIELDFFHIVASNMHLSDASKLCNNLYTVNKHFPSILYKIPKLSYLLSWVDVPLSLKKVLSCNNKEKYYDVVNIHYPQNKVLRCWKYFQFASRTTLITPWGSEVLRISRISQRIMASYISHYDYIMSSDNPRFREQLKTILNVSEKKFLVCDFGSEMIDELVNTKITKYEAKKHFGIGNKYTIVCGYNGGVAQNHIKMIESIMLIRNRLPQNLIIVLPMTYNTNPSYMNEVQKLLTDSRLDHIILKSYMSNHDMVYLRKCADMFIHAQNTDANSVSLAEHLLCDNIVVNANWLRYENREVFGIPYYLFNTFEELPNVIIKAYNGGAIVPEKLKNAISEEGWRTIIIKWVDLFKQIISVR